MKKVDFKKLAIMGIASGALIASQAGGAMQNADSNSSPPIYLAGDGYAGSGNSISNGSRTSGNSYNKRQRKEGSYHHCPKQWTMTRDR